MAVLRIDPAGFEIEVGNGETILAAAERAGVRWPSVCGGHAQCRTCWCRTAGDTALFSSPEPLERVALALLAPTMFDPGSVRLACQTRVKGNATVHKVGVRQPD